MKTFYGQSMPSFRPVSAAVNKLGKIKKYFNN